MPDYSDTRIQFRRGTAAEWSAANPILGNGEPGYDTTNDLLKVGNGADTWSNLEELGATQEDIDSALAALVDSAPETLDTLNEIAAAIGDNANFLNIVAYSGGNISQFNNDENYVASGDNISDLTNDANYVASGENISLLNNDVNYIESDTTDIAGASGVNNIVQISQSDYDAIGAGNYDLNTAYFVTDAPEINSNYVASGDNVSVFVNDANYVTSGDNVSVLNNDVGYLTSHPSISAAASSNNSGRTYIQDIFLDSNGHVLGLSTATETVVDTNTDTNTITNIGVNSTNYTNGNINFVGGGATSVSKVGNTVTITSSDTNTDTNNYVSSTSFSNQGNTLTINRQGLSSLTQAIGTANSPFGNVKLAGNQISSSEPNALYVNRTHANGLTAIAGGTYPSAADGGLLSTYGSSHAFSPGQTHVYYNSSTIRLLADANGITVYGTFTNNSDVTQKENVVPLSGCLDLVKNLNPVSFNFKQEEGLHNRTTVGFIAQEVQQTFKSLPYELGIVREIDYNTLSPSGEMNQKQILGISETNLIAILTKAVQELTARVEALESN